MKHSGERQHFFDMLLRYSSEPDVYKREIMEKEIWDEFGVSRAVFVLDMSGFSQLTQRYGLVHYLSLVRRMQVTTEPIIHTYSGEVVKYEADNCFALFPDACEAIQAAMARVPESTSIEYDPVTFNVSGLTIEACSIRFRRRGDPGDS